MAAIHTCGLTKDYGGGRGVFDLDLSVEEGEIFGFLGPNGAGKTTTMRLLMDLIHPTSGSATILGLDSRSDSTAIKHLVGYLPGELPGFGRMRGSEITGVMSGLRRVDATARVDALCRRLDLDLSSRYDDLSRGNKQKLGLVLALLHEPRLLILDEPTGGLDPLMQQEFGAFVREARDGGATVVLSSHVLSEVEHLCDRAAVVRDGRLARTLDLRAGGEYRTQLVEIRFSGIPPVATLRAVPGVEDVQMEGGVVRCALRGSVGPLITALAGAGVERLSTREISLQEMFLDLYRPAAVAR